mmetsp:Transcript_16003/g.23537  ORF Transcript_16003/g.23537 Transcript_16003/m.23537 type:complete len:283 (+) Transcript_16003:631-1479(+)
MAVVRVCAPAVVFVVVAVGVGRTEFATVAAGVDFGNSAPVIGDGFQRRGQVGFGNDFAGRRCITRIGRIGGAVIPRSPAVVLVVVVSFVVAVGIGQTGLVAIGLRVSNILTAIETSGEHGRCQIVRGCDFWNCHVWSFFFFTIIIIIVVVIIRWSRFCFFFFVGSWSRFFYWSGSLWNSLFWSKFRSWSSLWSCCWNSRFRNNRRRRFRNWGGSLWNHLRGRIRSNRNRGWISSRFRRCLNRGRLRRCWNWGRFRRCWHYWRWCLYFSSSHRRTSTHGQKVG